MTELVHRLSATVASTNLSVSVLPKRSKSCRCLCGFGGSTTRDGMLSTFFAPKASACVNGLARMGGLVYNRDC